MSRLPSPDVHQYHVPSIKPVAWFHAYVLCGVIGIRQGKFTPISAYENTNPGMYQILNEYLKYACGEDEWTKGRILEAMRFKTGTAMKANARIAFPSLFPRNKKARPLGVPDELSKEDVSFDIYRIEQWRTRVKAIKKEIIMNQNAVDELNVEETTQDNQLSVGNSDNTESSSNNRVTVNFFIPEGVNSVDLTLDNYRKVTQKRFRMTKDQAKVRGLTREEAFVESKALAVSQLGGK